MSDKDEFWIALKPRLYALYLFLTSLILALTMRLFVPELTQVAMIILTIATALFMIVMVIGSPRNYWKHKKKGDDMKNVDEKRRV